VLRNLFIGFIREEQQSRQTSSSSNSAEGPIGPSLSRSNSHHKPPSSPESPRQGPIRKASSSVVVCSPKMIPAIIPTISTTVRSSPLLAPLIPLNLHVREPSTVPQPPGASDATPTPGFHQRSRSGNVELSSSKIPLSTTKDDYFAARTRQHPTQGGMPSSPDDFSGWAGPSKTEPQTPSTPSGIMGRLKNFGGKITKRPVSDIASPLLATPSEVPPSPEVYFWRASIILEG
jgi:WD repeat-containing protein 48